MSDGGNESSPRAQTPKSAGPGNPPAAARLSTAQTTAMRALVCGKPIKDAAAEAGVDKSTLYRWRTRDLDFIQALTDCRMDAHSYCVDRMLSIADQAIEAVEGGLRKGDARMAFRLLLDLGRSVRAHPPAHAARLRQRHNPAPTSLPPDGAS
jgi:terminase small subunit-like protein